MEKEEAATTISCSDDEELNDLLQTENNGLVMGKAGTSDNPAPIIILPRKTKFSDQATVLPEMEMSEFDWKKSEPSPSSSGSIRKKFVFTLPGVMKQEKPREYKLKAFVVFLFFLIVIYISLTYVFHKQQELQVLQTEIAEGIHFHQSTRTLRILNSNRQEVLRGYLGNGLPSDLVPFECDFDYHDHSQCYNWKHTARLNITYLTLNDTTRCYSLAWESLTPNFAPYDCFVTKGAFWYGVGDANGTIWPLDLASNSDFKPFVTGADDCEYGSILERYWLSSRGVAVMVDWSVPLFANVKNDQICFKAKWNKPYHRQNDETLRLDYTVCRSSDVKAAHEYVAAFMRPKTMETPMLSALMERIVWKMEDDQNVLRYADEILDFFLEPSLIVIGSGWQEHEGDLTFDIKKFNNSGQVISVVRNKGFHVALEVHPYVSTDSTNYLNQIDYWIKDVRGTVPALTRWRNIRSAAIIDLTNEAAAQWFLDTIKWLNVDGLYFTGGSSCYLPIDYSTKNPISNPDYFLQNYVSYSFDSDLQLAITAAAGPSSKSNFILIPPRKSDWSKETGLGSLIPLVLSFGIAGFPFINPGNVGGDSAKPANSELFVRWMQVATFLPVVQFSTSFKIYDTETVAIAKSLLKLRQEVIAPLLPSLLDEAVRFGLPLVRPLWWVAPNDSAALTVESEFLVGDDLLVAPILEAGARYRDVYFPPGVWKDSVHDRLVIGSKWMFRVVAPLERVLHFKRVKN